VSDPGEPHRAYAGLISRFAGLVIDALLTALAVITVARGVPEVWRLVVGAVPSWLATAFRFVAAITPALYFAACWRMTGETLGSWIFGTRVTRRDGRLIGVVRAVLRAAIGLLLAPLWLIGLITVLFDGRRRSLLDMLFGTVVRYISRPGPAQMP
jgi:uncharacterized RDD family membrane protein YckC